MSPGSRTLLAVFLATLLVHAAARQGEFVFFDDQRFVVRNPALDRVGNPFRFFTDIQTTSAPDKPTRDIYRPVRTLSYALITAVAGRQDPSAFHAVSIVVHALTATLLAAVLLAAGLRAWAALAGALFWGLHPVTVEVSAWVCSLGDAWCGLFSLAAILLYAKDRCIGAHVALLLALFSKEHAVVVPGLWLAWDFFLRRDRWRAGLKRGAGPGLVIVTAFLLLRAHLGLKMSQIQEPLGGSHLQALLTMLSGLGWYARTILFPSGPTFQARVQPGVLSVAFGLLVLGGLVYALWRGSRRTRLGAGWFLLALVPVSNLLVPLKIATADRFLYLPLMGLALPAAVLVGRWPNRAAWAAPLTLAVLAGVTNVRIGDWKNSSALVAAGQRVNPKSLMLVWQTAAGKAQRARQLVRARDFARAERMVNEAAQEYYRYFKNTGPGDDSIQPWMELGDLLQLWGEWMDRRDHRSESIRAYGDALKAYLHAHELQLRGQGRVIEEEVRVAAEQAARLCVRLAVPANPNLSDVLRMGERMLRFLDERYQDPSVPMAFAQLRIVYCSQIRGREPQKARRGLDQVLEILNEQEKRKVDTRFLRGQTLLYRSLLKPYSRQDAERAYALFVQVAKERPAQAPRATFLSARACCVIAKLFGDKQMANKGHQILALLPQVAKRSHQRISKYFQAEILAETKGCAAR